MRIPPAGSRGSIAVGEVFDVDEALELSDTDPEAELEADESEFVAEAEFEAGTEVPVDEAV